MSFSGLIKDRWHWFRCFFPITRAIYLSKRPPMTEKKNRRVVLLLGQFVGVATRTRAAADG